MNGRDAQIAMRALNLDGGEGSGVKGHFTAKEHKAIESAVSMAKLLSPSQSAAIDLNRHQVAFHDAQNMAARHNEWATQAKERVAEVKANLEIAKQRDAARTGPVNMAMIRAEHEKYGGLLSTRDYTGLLESHEKGQAEHEKNARFYAKLADKLNARGDD